MDINDIEKQRLQNLEEVRSFSCEEILDDLEKSLMATDILLSAHQLSDGFSDAASIIFTGFLHTRVAIENAIEWIEANTMIDIDEDDTEDNEDTQL